MAITYQDSIAGAYTTTGNASLSTSASVGDLIVVFAVYANLTGSVTATVSDNVSSGNYSNIFNYYDSGSRQFVVASKVVTTAGTPTITCTNMSAGGFVSAVRYNGFTGTITTDVNSSSGYNGFSTAVDSGSMTLTGTTELILGFTHNSNANTVPGTAGAFTLRFGSADSYSTAGLEYIASSGGTADLSFTMSANALWWACVVGFYGVAGAANPGPIFYRRYVPIFQ